MAVFALTGPFTGLLAIALQSGSKGSVSDVFHPFALLLAAAIGGPPAIVAGVVYGLLALAIVSVFPRVRVKALLGSLLGVSVGAAVASVYFAYFLSGNENITAKLTESVHLGALAGLLSGLISGWLFPVGREPIANPTSLK